MEFPIIRQHIIWTAKDPSPLIAALIKILTTLGLYDEQQTKLIFQPEAVNKFWIPAFTHRNYDAHQNYESLEYFGDSTLKYNFNKYIRHRFYGQTIPESTATWLLNEYMSEDNQPEFAEKMGLQHLLHHNEKTVSNKIKEDLFEAFAGALDETVDKYIFLGAGSVYVYNMLAIFFDKIHIDITAVRRGAVSELKELFNKLSWGEVRYDISPSNLSGSGPMMAKIYGNDGKVLGVGYGVEKEARRQAAEKALTTLANTGIATSAHLAQIEHERQQRQATYDQQWTQTLQYFEIYKNVLRKNQSQPPNEIKVINKSHDKNSYTSALQFIWHLPNGESKTVEAYPSKATTQQDAQINAMKTFINAINAQNK